MLTPGWASATQLYPSGDGVHPDPLADLPAAAAVSDFTVAMMGQFTTMPDGPRGGLEAGSLGLNEATLPAAARASTAATDVWRSPAEEQCADKSAVSRTCVAPLRAHFFGTAKAVGNRVWCYVCLMSCLVCVCLPSVGCAVITSSE